MPPLWPVALNGIARVALLFTFFCAALYATLLLLQLLWALCFPASRTVLIPLACNARAQRSSVLFGIVPFRFDFIDFSPAKTVTYADLNASLQQMRPKSRPKTVTYVIRRRRTSGCESVPPQSACRTAPTGVRWSIRFPKILRRQSCRRKDCPSHRCRHWSHLRWKPACGP